MLVIQATWTVLIVAVAVVLITAFFWGRDRKWVVASWHREVQELHQNHAATLLKSQEWAKAMAEGHQHDLIGQAAIHASVKRGLGLMIQTLVPYALRQALLHDDKIGEPAARLVYIANCMGLVEANKDTAKQIARGQLYAKINPTELTRLVESLGVDKEPAKKSVMPNDDRPLG